MTTTLPTDSDERKNVPMATGALDYFPATWAAIAQLSKVGNDKHNPGQPLHWSRGKSGDHADCIMRHLAERGTLDTDGVPHSVKVAWRACALAQEELEARGAPLSRASRLPDEPAECRVSGNRIMTPQEFQDRITADAREVGLIDDDEIQHAPPVLTEIPPRGNLISAWEQLKARTAADEAGPGSIAPIAAESREPSGWARVDDFDGVNGAWVRR